MNDIQHSAQIEPDLRVLGIDLLRLSQTAQQIERRKHFDKTALQELAESIKSVGQLQPIVARPRDGRGTGNGAGYEIVAGERRFLAAKIAGMDALQVSIREFTDQQVLEVQLVENLQREGLHELTEAEGYEALRKSYGYSIDDLLAKVGKSRAYIFARLKLLALGKQARKAFYDGELNASIALLIARIPVESLQQEALEDLRRLANDQVRGKPGMPSTREAARHIQRRYMLALSDAPFPTAEEGLVTDAPGLPGKAPPCGTCPYNTNAQPELFADVEVSKKGAGVCTNPVCFGMKRDAFARRRIDEARTTGQRVIEGAAAKTATRYGTHSLQGSLVKLDDHCYDDSKQRTYRQLLGKEFQPALLVVPPQANDSDAPTVIEVADRSEVAPLLKERGVHRAQATRSSSGSADAARDRKQKIEREFRRELYEALREKFDTKLGRSELNAIAAGFFRRLDHDARKRLAEFWEWEPKRKTGYPADYENPVLEQIPKLTLENLVVFLQDLVYIGELHVGSYDTSQPTQLLALAKQLKVNPDPIRKRLSAEAGARGKAKTAKKPAKVPAKAGAKAKA